MNYYKKDEVIDKEKTLEATKSKVIILVPYELQFHYDLVKGDESLDYCKKCKYESKWCKHRKEREEAKQNLEKPLTT